MVHECENHYVEHRDPMLPEYIVIHECMVCGATREYDTDMCRPEGTFF